MKTLSFTRGSAEEARHLNALRERERSGRAVIYSFDTKGAAGAGVDLEIEGEGYRVEVSPDGKNWLVKRDASLSSATDVPDSGWIHFVEATDCLARNGSLFVRLSAPTDARAFARRLVVYGSVDSDKLYVRVSGSFTLNQVRLRTWSL